MKTTIKCLMLAFVAMLACVTISSCSNEEDDDLNKGFGNYYFQLYAVETNCIDTNGNSLAPALMAEWIEANNADAQGKITIGKFDSELAKSMFDGTIDLFVQGYNEAYAGKNKLPENGWIIYSFSLGSDAAYGGATANAVIEVTNTGARLM